MKKFTLQTIRKGRLNNKNMNEIVGGDIVCPIYFTSECLTASRGFYTHCSGVPAATYENCSSLGYDSCTSIYDWCYKWG